MAIERRTLSPSAWFNRCVDAYGDEAAGLVNLGSYGSELDLLKALSSEASSLDVRLGTREAVEWDPNQIRWARTLVGSLKKFRDPVDGVSRADLESAAFARYKANNLAAKANVIPRRFVQYMREFLSECLAGFESVEMLMDGRLSPVCACPRFGNGGVEEKASVVKRWAAIPKVKDFDFRDPLGVVPPATPGWARPMNRACRLHAVPKDWNKLRLITIEPYAASYLQQTVRGEILLALLRCKAGDLRAMARCEHCCGSDPQLRHRRMALEGSMDGSLATLDLSDASDHVSWSQVTQVFPVHVLAELERARSTEYYDTTEPSKGGAKPLHEVYMFAGMGNACTFIVETMMFHAACHAIARYHRIQNPRISVFGDDIVCSSELATLIVTLGLFDEFGWKINREKSYYDATTRFRESCGIQAFKGHDVTLLRYQGQYDGLKGAQALCDLVHRCGSMGYTSLLAKPWNELQGIPNIWCTAASGIYTHVQWWPETTSTHEVAFRWNANLQRREVNLLHLAPSRRFVPIRDLGCVYGALSGQLAGKTVIRGSRGRKVAGILVDDPDVAVGRMEWTPITSSNL